MLTITIPAVEMFDDEKQDEISHFCTIRQNMKKHLTI